MSEEVQELDVDLDNVTQIFHLADVHIRQNKRHGEYREVFERLYSAIEDRKTSGSVAVVAGDLVHSKNDLSPEMVDLASELLRNLSELVPTVVIPGNHDHLASNPDRLDAISPIIDNLVSADSLFYLKHSGVWSAGDTAFVHMSQQDDPEDYVPASEVPDGFENVVALYHGTVDDSVTDTGYALDSDVSLDTFADYDMALLGDIHRHQYMDLSETVAFPGSLIQQNHGEDLGHGFLAWDADSRDAEFVELHNDYGYYTLEVDNGAVPVDGSVPSKPRLRLRVSNTSAAELNRVTSDVRQIYDVQELRYDRQSDSPGKSSGEKKSDVNVGDIRSPSYQSKLIEKYLRREHDVDDETVSRVKGINKDINGRVESEDLRRNAQWRLKRFEWDNMFSYGEGNEIEFEKMGGIVGLFAENASGKSSLLDAISFCLFDKCSRAYKSTDILNNQSEWFRCKAVFELDGTEYVVERTAEMQSDGRLPVDVDFHKVEDGEQVSLNGERRWKTNKKIQSYIGEYEDFILTALSVQGNNTIFVEKSQSQRKDLLSRFIGIDVFDRLHGKAKDEIREVEALMENFESRDISEEYADAERRLESAKAEFREAKERKSELEAEEEELEGELMEYHKKLVDIPDEDLDVESLRRRKKELEGEIEDVAGEREHAEIKKREKEQPLQGYRDMLGDVNESKLREDKEEFQDIREKRVQARDRIEGLGDRIEKLESEAEHLESHEFDPECEYCVERNERDAKKLESVRERLEDAREERSRLRDQAAQLQHRMAAMSQGKDPWEAWEELKNIKSKVSELEQDVREREMEIREKRVEESELRSELESVEGDIKLWEKIQDDVRRNREIRESMEPVEDRLESIRSELSRAASDVQDCFSRIKVAERDRDQAKEDLEEYRDLSEKSEAYNLYLEATERDGVPYDIIEDVMPQIEQEVNEILSQIVPFGIMMHLDGKNIDARIIYDEKRYWPVELASGMEKFVSSLAIRVALINISNMPRPNFLAVDEGFGVLDKGNLNSLNLLFDYLKSKFRFCVVISHLEAMRDMVGDHIEIEESEEGRSRVSYP